MFPEHALHQLRTPRFFVSHEGGACMADVARSVGPQLEGGDQQAAPSTDGCGRGGRGGAKKALPQGGKISSLLGYDIGHSIGLGSLQTEQIGGRESGSHQAALDPVHPGARHDFRRVAETTRCSSQTIAAKKVPTYGLLLLLLSLLLLARLRVSPLLVRLLLLLPL